MDVRDLDIDLIDRINPFSEAYAIMAKTMNEDSLKRFAEVIAGKNHYFDVRCIASVAYTDPELAWVGVTEQEAKQQGINYKIGAFPWAASGRALCQQASIGKTKLIYKIN